MTNGISEHQFNIHSAVDEEQCEEMGQRNGWELEAVAPTDDPILKVDCYFVGEQTNFEDTRYGD